MINLNNFFYFINSIYDSIFKIIFRNSYEKKGKHFFLYPSLILSSHKASIKLGENVIINGYLISEGGYIEIGSYTSIGRGSTVRAMKNIKIGSFCLISSGVYIIDNNSHSLSYEDRKKDILNNHLYHKNKNNIPNKNVTSKQILIGDNVWIGRNATILKGVEIGSGSVVATNTVVTKNVPPYTLVAGNPGKIVKVLK